MSYFSDDREMYVPLSIDTVEARRTNYFFSNIKMLWAFLAFIPIFALVVPMLRVNAGIIAITVVVVVYMILYIYFFRFVIFEERKLRKMVRELDENRISEVDYFWGIDKVGSGEHDDGVIYYTYKGNAKGATKGIVIKLDRGSTVGVPEGHYREYRKVKENFFRSLHINNMYPICIEMQRKPEIQESIKDYTETLKNMDNEYHKKLLKLNISINNLYAMSKRQRYVEYIIVKSNDFTANFKRVLETILDDTFAQSGHFVEVKMLNKFEVSEFFKAYLMIDTLDMDNVGKYVDVVPFENFAKVHSIIDEDGAEVPLEFLDKYDYDMYGGRSIEKEVEKSKIREKEKEAVRSRMYKNELNKLNERRNKGLLTQQEFLDEKDDLKRIFSGEDFEKDIQEYRNKKRKKERTKINKEKENTTPDIKVYNLDDDKTESYVSGEENVDDLIRKQELSEIFNKYK